MTFNGYLFNNLYLSFLKRNKIIFLKQINNVNNDLVAHIGSQYILVIIY